MPLNCLGIRMWIHTPPHSLPYHSVTSMNTLCHIRKENNAHIVIFGIVMLQ